VSDSLDALQRTFAMLCAKYQVKLPGMVAQFEDLWRRLLAAEAPVSVLADLIQIAHNIAGTGKTFGFASAGAVAREIELCLEPVCAAARLPDAAEQERVAALLAALKRAAQ
jgi:HPt (histidine-containing phosphotransfer) domain-containing protein